MSQDQKWAADAGRRANRNDALLRLAQKRMQRGFAPPSAVYRVENRRRIDWQQFPEWARPVDPQIFEGCCHEG